MYMRQLIFLRKSDCFGCAVLLCIIVCLTLFASFFLPSHLSLKYVHLYTWFGVWCLWWFHYPGLLLHTELLLSLFIMCTMRCEIWAQPAELPCCLFDLACFFQSSFSALIKTCIRTIFRMPISGVITNLILTYPTKYPPTTAR